MCSLRLKSLAIASLFFVSSFVLTPLSHASWPPVTKEDLEFKNVPDVPDAPAVILYHEEIDDDLLHYHQVYYKIKILTEAGRKYADVKIEFDKHGSDVGSVKGRTTHADGTVLNFEGKPLEKEVELGPGYKVMAKTITLPDVQVGSVIEYGYAWRYDDNLVSSPTWILQDDLFQRKEHYKFTPTQSDVVNEQGVASSGLAWVAQLPKGGEIKDIRHQHYELTLNDVPPFVEEEQMPPASAFKYRVNFYYRYAVEKDAYWKDEGKIWNKNAEKFLSKDAGVGSTVATLIQPSDSAEQKARKIYAFVQTLENTSYLPEKTQIELKANGIKRNLGVEDVLRQKRGNRDEITRTFVAMARSAGIPAYLMWVADRGITIFEPMFLSTNQLDDEIALITIDGKEIGVDPGTKFAPFGVLNWHYSATRGLRQTSAGKTEIATSPMPKTGGDIIQRAGVFKLSDEGEVSGSAVIRFYGQEALARRIRAAKTDAAGRRKLLEDEVKGWLPSNAEVSLTKEPDWNDYEKPLTTEFHIAAPILSRAGKRVLMPTDFFVVNRPPMFSHNERKQIVYFHHPLREVDAIRIMLPPSLEVETMTTNTSLEVGYAGYKAEHAQEARSIVTHRDLELGSLVFPTPEYKNLKTFYDKVKEGDDQQIVLRSAAHAQGN